VSICFGFGKDICKPIYHAIDDETLGDGQYYLAPYRDASDYPAVWFELKSTLFGLFNDESTTADGQEKLIREFVMEVLSK